MQVLIYKDREAVPVKVEATSLANALGVADGAEAQWLVYDHTLYGKTIIPVRGTDGQMTTWAPVRRSA